VPAILPVRQGYRDLHRVMTFLGGFIVTVMISLLWSAPPQYDSTVMGILCICTGFVLIFPGFIFWVSLWNVWTLRDGRMVLGEDGRLAYAWRTDSTTLNLAEVHTIRWWWTKNQSRWRSEPIRLWTVGRSMWIDPNAFTVPDREHLVAWLRAHLPPQVVHLGQDEFALEWVNMRRSPSDWAAAFPWLFGWRFLVLLAGPALFAAVFGGGYWAFLRYYYPDLGPVDVSGPHDGPFGRILLASIADWALYLALPVLAMVGAILSVLRGIIWLDRYTNRDAYDLSRPPP
jgi:hypothetical protein